MSVAIVIPSRWGSTRFPGKPLESILGRSMIERVWRIACAAGDHEVLVATDDTRIADHVESLGGRTVMTGERCRNGTERVHEALRTADFRPEVVVNLQGDAVLTPPWVLTGVIEAMRGDASIELATPAVRMSWEELERFREARASGSVGGTTVTFDANGDALYFSKSLIPNVRETGCGECPVFRHIGLYAYRPPTLDRLLALEPGPLETAEKLEQLRALENGIGIRVVEVDYRGRTHGSVDNPSDVAEVEAIIRREGELV